MSRHIATLNKMALYRGVIPLHFDSTKSKPGSMTADVIAALKESGLMEVGDQVMLTYGDQMETVGATNACKIVTIV